ncbi:MAG: glycosyltransferase family 2 protein [Bacillota bacterium]
MTSVFSSFSRVSIIVPVFNHTRFLESCIRSAINQTYPEVEIIVRDDCSTDPEVSSILRRFQGTPRVKIYFSKTNEGISMATNRAIIQSTGHYLAFLDCDDILPPHAIETAVSYLKANPHVRYFYSNREQIDEKGKVVSRSEFHEYSFKNPSEQILKFMFASHLKIIKREAFYEVGLFKKEFDSCQDYDLALRMSEKYSFFHIPEYLYQYRIHPYQISQVKKREQAVLAYQARDVAVVRRRIFKGDIGSKKISIVMLTLNRWQRTRITLEQLVKNTGLPFELIILDNNSSDDTVKFLQWFAKQNRNVHLMLESENLGCAWGRKKAIRKAQGDFIVTLDNDVRVTPGWLENLLVRLKESQAHAACCKVVMPNGKIQYNGGNYRISGKFIVFSFIDNNLNYNDLKTYIDRKCLWLPGGATIYRRSVFEKIDFCEELYGGLEDNDLSLQMNKAGLKMVNSPASLAVHHHASTEGRDMRDTVYMLNRYDWDRLKNSMITFYRRHRVIVYDPWLFKQLGIPHGTRQETIDFFNQKAMQKQNPNQKGAAAPSDGNTSSTPH